MNTLTRSFRKHFNCGKTEEPKGTQSPLLADGFTAAVEPLVQQ